MVKKTISRYCPFKELYGPCVCVAGEEEQGGEGQQEGEGGRAEGGGGGGRGIRHIRLRRRNL